MKTRTGGWQRGDRVLSRKQGIRSRLTLANRWMSRLFCSRPQMMPSSRARFRGSRWNNVKPNIFQVSIVLSKASIWAARGILWSFLSVNEFSEIANVSSFEMGVFDENPSIGDRFYLVEHNWLRKKCGTSQDWPWK